MKKLLVILALCLLGQTAHGEKVVSLQQKDLTDIPGKEGLMVTVEIAPGESVPKHRHNSDVFVHVLSGTIVTQVQGQSAKTLHAGETFVEAPADIHLDSRKHDYSCSSLRIRESRPPSISNRIVHPTEAIHHHLESSHQEQA